MSWAGMKSLGDKRPQNIELPNVRFTKEQKRKYLEDVIGKFVQEYVMVELDAVKEIRKGKYGNTE